MHRRGCAYSCKGWVMFCFSWCHLFESLKIKNQSETRKWFDYMRNHKRIKQLTDSSPLVNNFILGRSVFISLFLCFRMKFQKQMNYFSKIKKIKCFLYSFWRITVGKVLFQPMGMEMQANTHTQGHSSFTPQKCSFDTFPKSHHITFNAANEQLREGSCQRPAQQLITRYRFASTCSVSIK